MEFLAAAPVAVWLYLLLARGMFWRFSKWVAPPDSLPAPRSRVAVVIPARDEAEWIGACVRSLVAQAEWVFVVDDGSGDATAVEARGAGATVITGAPLPPGWSGKLWAVEQGIQIALAGNPQFLLLTDADIRHDPESVARLVRTAEEGSFDLVSQMVKLRCETFAEKLLMPAFVFFFLMLYPPAWIRDSRHATAGAAGGSMLIRPEALQRAGGIAAIRREIIDDCALARAVKRSGGRVSLRLTAATVSLRSYGSFAEIGRMISRSAFNQLRHSTVLLCGSVLGLAVTYLLPPLALLSTQGRLCGAAACVLMTVAYFPAVRFFGLSPAWALTLPLSSLFYLAATVHSAVQYWRGRGGEWKGRVQDSREL